MAGDNFAGEASTASSLHRILNPRRSPDPVETGSYGSYSAKTPTTQNMQDAWATHCSDGFPREVWNGSTYEKWETVKSRKDFLAFVQVQHDNFAPCHTSINVCGTPDSGYGVYWINKLLLEIDGKSVDSSHRQMRRLYCYLKMKYDTEPRVYFSGHRSFHVYVDFMPLVLEDPAEVPGAFASRLQKEIINLDLDHQVFARRHLSRVPFTLHEDTCNYCLPVSPHIPLRLLTDKRAAAPIEIHYSTAVRSALIAIDQELASRPKPKASTRRRGNSQGWVERLLEHPVSDGRHRLLWKVLSPYVVTQKGLSEERAVELLNGFFLRCHELKPLQPARSSFLRLIRYHVRRAIREGIKPARLETIQASDPQLFAIIQEVLPNAK